MANIIEICEQAVPWRLERRSRLQKLYIQVHPQEGVIVRAPVGLKLSKVVEVLSTQENWLTAKIDEISRKCPRREYGDGETLPYLGREIKLRLLESNNRRPLAQWADDEIHLQLSEPNRETARECLRWLYRQRARNWFPVRVDKLNSQYFRHSIGRVVVKEQSTLLGSCSSRGNLNFNWRLMLAPLEVVDYVVTHELAHLTEMNHSRQFWQAVEKICPEYKRHRKWLRDMSATLYI